MIEIKVDTNEKSGITELIQYGVQLPDGRQIWTKTIGETLVELPIGNRIVSLPGAEGSASWTWTWEKGIHEWERQQKVLGLVLTEEQPRPFVIQRTIIVAVGNETKYPTSRS